MIAGLVTLLAVVCVSLGLVTEVALQHFLVGRLDAQLVAAGGRSSSADGPSHGGDSGGAGGPGPDGGGNGAQFLLAPGQASGTLGARLIAGQVTAAGVLTNSGSLQSLTSAQTSALLSVPADGRPYTRAVGGHGDFRLLATRSPDGDVLLTGLPLTGVQATLWQLAIVEFAVAGGALVVVISAGAAIVRRTMRPLGRVAALATRVSTLPLGRGEVALADRVATADTDPGTEVGQVGAALNQLLDNVTDALQARQASESQVRQFVADASHELRTPLAAIRGYAEVTRRSRESAPPELAHAMGRVESEAIRMTALVEDLLLLARLDAGRPLGAERVDLTQLVVDAVSDASAAGPHHRWVLDLAAEPVIAQADGARLHQVLANLLANARGHTPPGTTVTARLRATSDQVVLAVVDDGPGIPPALLPSVFERFARGERSRTRGAGGTGLGLAIVAAIVAAHRGSVEVTSTTGGTTFLVRLPTDAAQPSAAVRPSGPRAAFGSGRTTAPVVTTRT